MPPSKPQIILGIDPGTKRIGYGLVAFKQKEFSFLGAGLLIPRIAKTTSKQTLLEKIHLAINQIVKTYSPHLIAIERIYFGQNISSALAVSEIRGALSLMAYYNRVPVIDVHPTNVKQVVCGYGHADKSAVRKMVFKLVANIPDSLSSRDAIDALAIALTGYYNAKKDALIDKQKKSDKTNTD